MWKTALCDENTGESPAAALEGQHTQTAKQGDAEFRNLSGRQEVAATNGST